LNPSPEDLRTRLSGTNISADTLLATDYLNHFNEIIMMLELVADMPEMLDDAKSWKPLGYVDHFRFSQFAERDLAIEVYGLIPEPRRRLFEDSVALAHARVAGAVTELDEAIKQGDAGMVRHRCGAIARDLHHLVDNISVIIHGGAVALDQPDIDGLMAKAADQGSPPVQSIGQDDIDKLFD